MNGDKFLTISYVDHAGDAAWHGLVGLDILPANTKATATI